MSWKCYLVSASILAVGELETHVRRIRGTVHDDPALAIGSAKELLETVLRTILGEYGAQPAGDIHDLLKRVQKKLKLDPSSADGQPGAETIRRTLSNLGQVVVGVAEVRNLFGTGHGRSRAAELERAQAEARCERCGNAGHFPHRHLPGEQLGYREPEAQEDPAAVGNKRAHGNPARGSLVRKPTGRFASHPPQSDTLVLIDRRVLEYGV